MTDDQDLEVASGRFERNRAAFEKALGECEEMLAKGGLGLDRYARLKKMHAALILERAALQSRIKQALEDL